MIDMKEFSKAYSNAYETFYNSDSSVMNCIEYYFTKQFDNRYNNDDSFTNTANDFMEYRKDALTSDREVAAFCITYIAFMNEY